MAGIRRGSERLRKRLDAAVARGMEALVAQSGQAEWIQQVMVIGIVVLIAAAIFVFWKGGGLTWINNQLGGITQY